MLRGAVMTVRKSAIAPTPFGTVSVDQLAAVFQLEDALVLHVGGRFSCALMSASRWAMRLRNAPDGPDAGVVTAYVRSKSPDVSYSAAAKVGPVAVKLYALTPDTIPASRHSPLARMNPAPPESPSATIASLTPSPGLSKLTRR